jgi:formate--tetrahydrofolate ligase
MPLEADVRIARQAKMRPILDIARDLGLPEDCVELHGPYKAKINLDALPVLGPPTAKVIVVTAMTPTPLGEGKTVNTIGLSLGLNRLGKRAAGGRRSSRWTRSTCA